MPQPILRTKPEDLRSRNQSSSLLNIYSLMPRDFKEEMVLHLSKIIRRQGRYLLIRALHHQVLLSPPGPAHFLLATVIVPHRMSFFLPLSRLNSTNNSRPHAIRHTDNNKNKFSWIFPMTLTTLFLGLFYIQSASQSLAFNYLFSCNQPIWWYPLSPDSHF